MERFKERVGKVGIKKKLLSTAREGVRKTEIHHKSYLSLKGIKRYIPSLEERRFEEISLYMATSNRKDFRICGSGRRYVCS